VAYVAGRLLTGRSSSAIFDFESGNYFNYSGDVTPARVHVYDYDRDCFIGGSPESLFDYGSDTFIQLSVQRPQQFRGFDFGSSDHFDGTVANGKVSLFDYGSGTYSDYQL
jgi:hypothetical protein